MIKTMMRTIMPMQKALTVVFVCICTVCTHAQDGKRKNALHSVIGLNISMPNGKWTSEQHLSSKTKEKFGYVLGVDIEHQYNDVIGGCIGLHYSLNGMRCSDSSSETDFTRWNVKDFYTNLHYLQIPLLIKAKLFSSFSIYTGIKPGWLIKAVSHNKNEYYKKEENEWIIDDVNSGKASSNVTSLYKRIDIKIPIMLSYEFRSGTIAIVYDYGLTNIRKNSSDKITNNSVTLIYSFPIL